MKLCEISNGEHEAPCVSLPLRLERGLPGPRSPHTHGPPDLSPQGLPHPVLRKEAEGVRASLRAGEFGSVFRSPGGWLREGPADTNENESASVPRSEVCHAVSIDCSKRTSPLCLRLTVFQPFAFSVHLLPTLLPLWAPEQVQQLLRFLI